MAFFGLLLGGYVPAPISDIAAAATWEWTSAGDAINRPIQIASDSTWTMTSTGNLTVAPTSGLAAASTWTWSSVGDIDEAATGPRGRRTRNAAAGPGRSSAGAPGSGARRGSPASAAAAGGRS